MYMWGGVDLLEELGGSICACGEDDLAVGRRPAYLAGLKLDADGEFILEDDAADQRVGEHLNAI